MKTVKTAVSGIFWALIVTVSILMGAGRLAGFEALIVQSGSMEPGIPTGSLAVVDTGCDYGSIETGDIIIFQAGEERVMHRAYAVTEKGIETKGDANEVTDGITTTRENLVGRVVSHIPLMGFLVNGVRELLPVVGAALSFSIFSER